MRPLPLASLAAIAGLLAFTSACGPKTYEGEPEPDVAAQPQPADTAAQQADTAAPQTPAFDSAAQVMDTAAQAMEQQAQQQPSLALDANADGQSIFRHDTFGNEQYWTDTLRLHEVITQRLDPTTALQHGLKVDAEAVPPGALDSADLSSPATTVALLKANAIVGIKAMVDENNQVTRVGITCALCHSTVDNSTKENIGRRIDGAPNRQLNVGALLAMSPVVTDEQKQVFNSWGPGKYDPYYNQDGKSIPVVIPPLYGLQGVENVTYTAVAPINLWNQYVAVTQMHGVGPAPSIEGIGAPDQGQDSMMAQPDSMRRDTIPQQGDTVPQRGDPMVPQGDTAQAQAQPQEQGLGDMATQQMMDLVTAKLPALGDYQHSLEVPQATNGDSAAVNQTSVTRGERVFRRACISCHVNVTGTDNNTASQATEVSPGGGTREGDLAKGRVHAPNETGMDPQYAERSPSRGYRTTPLRGLAQHAPYFHDGSAETLEDVVKHYNEHLKLKLTQRQQRDLAAFLKTK